MILALLLQGSIPLWKWWVWTDLL